VGAGDALPAPLTWVASGGEAAVTAGACAAQGRPTSALRLGVEGGRLAGHPHAGLLHPAVPAQDRGWVAGVAGEEEGPASWRVATGKLAGHAHVRCS